jgi:hypothetical protein
VLRCLLMVCASSTLLLHTARAQAQAVTWPPLSQPSVSSLYPERPTTPLDLPLIAGEPSESVVQIEPTYWKEGGLVGGVLSGVLLALFAEALCTYGEGNTRNCGMKLVAGAALGGGMGFVLGALVGGQFPKGPRRVSSDSAEVR